MAVNTTSVVLGDSAMAQPDDCNRKWLCPQFAPSVLMHRITAATATFAFMCSLLVAVAAGCDTDRSTVSSRPKTVEEAAPDCSAKVARLRAEYDRLMSANQYLDASLQIRSAMHAWYACPETQNDPALIALLAEAEIKTYSQLIDNPDASSSQKLNVIDLLMRDYPAVGKKYVAQRAQLVAEASRVEKQRAAEESARRKKEAAERKRQGVRVGMTMADVLASSWGKPSSVRKTTTAFSSTEFWCYDEYCSSSLLFEDGRLAVINN